MSSSFTFGASPEAEVLTFKQSNGESLKDAWYRINDAQRKSIKKQSTTILLRNFYVGVNTWSRFVLDTSIGGNFLEVHTLEALNVMENLVGTPPMSEIKTEFTLGNVMERLDQIEKSMPRADRINFIDRKLHGSIGKLDVSLKKVANTLETFVAKDNHSSRIDKIEDVIDIVGITLSSVKAKKVETP